MSNRLTTRPCSGATPSFLHRPCEALPGGPTRARPFDRRSMGKRGPRCLMFRLPVLVLNDRLGSTISSARPPATQTVRAHLCLLGEAEDGGRVRCLHFTQPSGVCRARGVDLSMERTGETEVSNSRSGGTDGVKLVGFVAFKSLKRCRVVMVALPVTSSLVRGSLVSSLTRASRSPLTETGAFALSGFPGPP